jgi:hypothetical protein
VLKNRPLLLILASLALGALVWFDNRQSSDPQSQTQSGRSQETARAAGDDEARATQADAEEGAAPGQLQLDNPLASFEKAKLKDWVERPLFASSRKRPAAVKVAERPILQAQPKRPAPSYDLLGIVRDGDHAIALLRKKGEGTSFRVEVGDMIGGWRVARMEPASVVLERQDGTSQTVPLTRE